MIEYRTNVRKGAEMEHPSGKLKRKKILKYIKQFIKVHGYAPSYREIQDACGISSTSVVSYHLNVLEAQGKIDRSSFKSRTVHPIYKWD